MRTLRNLNFQTSEPKLSRPIGLKFSLNLPLVGEKGMLTDGGTLRKQGLSLVTLLLRNAFRLTGLHRTHLEHRVGPASKAGALHGRRTSGLGRPERSGKEIRRNSR